MNALRILVHHGKYGNTYWLADTPTREAQAKEELFRHLDSMHYYDVCDSDRESELICRARDGDMKSIFSLLSARAWAEYEGWEICEMIVPCNGGLPGPTELLDFNTYQMAAHGTAEYPQHAGILYAALGLAGEGGEVAGKLLDLLIAGLEVTRHTGEVANQVKKVLRDDTGVLTRKRKLAIIKELGGVFWYAAEIATIMDVDLAVVPSANLCQLYSRKERGTIKGDGDDR